MNEIIPPSKEALNEAINLSKDIIQNIELNELSLTNIALKTLRLARLLNDFEMEKILRYEVSGYPSEPDGIPSDIYKLGILAKRGKISKDEETSEIEETVYTQSIEELELKIRTFQISLEAARDPDISLSSANPRQFIPPVLGNVTERLNIRTDLIVATKRLSERRSFIHEYVLKKYSELKFSSIADDIFSRIRERVDIGIGKHLPDSIKRFSAIYTNLQSENPEDWSNAVHSCRRILKDLADAIFPPRDPIIINIDGNEKEIKLGKEQYINRIITFIEEKSNSNSYKKIVGSNLTFIEDRLNAVLEASHKGTHDTIISKVEADRYVVYTYMIIGDILTLI
ncbi:hypothetical protein ES703_61131 [subsurface metagenome]